MKKYISILLIFAACSSSTGNEPEPPAFEAYRIGSWEVFAEKQARWVGLQAAAKATGDSVHITEPVGYGFIISKWPEHIFQLPLEVSSGFVVELQDSTITDLPDRPAIVWGVDYQIVSHFPEEPRYHGLYPDDRHVKFESGYHYECSDSLHFEGNEIIEFWHDFSGVKKTFIFEVDGYLETIHHIACD